MQAWVCVGGTEYGVAVMGVGGERYSAGMGIRKDEGMDLGVGMRMKMRMRMDMGRNVVVVVDMYTHTSLQVHVHIYNHV